MDDLVNDDIQLLMSNCRLMKVIVTLVAEDDEYYLHFDGTNSNANPNFWIEFWGSFADYARNAAAKAGWQNIEMNMVNDLHVTMFIGTLFDLLSDHENTATN